MTSPVCPQLQTNCCVTANLEKGPVCVASHREKPRVFSSIPVETDHAPIVSGRSAHVVLRSHRKAASNCLQSNRLRLRCRL
jgi:hypothetical protein